MPGVMEILVAPEVIQLSVVGFPATIEDGVATKEMIEGPVEVLPLLNFAPQPLTPQQAA